MVRCYVVLATLFLFGSCGSDPNADIRREMQQLRQEVLELTKQVNVIEVRVNRIESRYIELDQQLQVVPL